MRRYKPTQTNSGEKLVTLTLHREELWHLQCYIRAVYAKGHYSNGELHIEDCVYCKDFLIKTEHVLSQAKLEDKIEQMRILQKRAREDQLKASEELTKG